VPGKVIDKVTTTKEKIPGVDHVPHIPKPGFFWFIPMIPFRRRERYVTQKQVKQWQFTPSKEIMKPRFFREEVDQAWVRIRPEAVQEDGTLVQNSWAFTRKYEHLLRDGRITDVLRADFDSPEGEDKQLRIMFVDHAPAKETVAMFTELLEKFAAMDGGKIADRVSGIFVYPSENAGTEHDEPKRIAMGVDKQSESNVLGTYTYILDLVELHMPTDVDPKELEELLSSFDGPAWTLAHEVAGHGTDDSDEPLRLRRIAGHPIPNAHVIEGDPRAQKMKPLEKVLSRLPRHGKKREKDAPPIEFDIEYQVPDKNGQLVTMQARVEEGDPRLSHASHATIVGYIPTQYGGTNNPEHYAETAAATTTGIAVPYHEATVSVPLLKTDEGEQAVFADGYRPDARGQQVFTKSVGAEQGIFPVSFKADPSREEPPVTISHMRPEYDALLRQEMIRTRGLRTLTPAQMVAILARVTQRNSKKA